MRKARWMLGVYKRRVEKEVVVSGLVRREGDIDCFGRDARKGKME